MIARGSRIGVQISLQTAGLVYEVVGAAIEWRDIDRLSGLLSAGRERLKQNTEKCAAHQPIRDDVVAASVRSISRTSRLAQPWSSRQAKRKTPRHYLRVEPASAKGYQKVCAVNPTKVGLPSFTSSLVESAAARR